MEIKDKKIIITGAGNGIGKELTKQLLGKGAYVYGLDINEENLNSLKEELNNERLKTYVIDMGSRESISSFKEKFLSENDGVDILINNAGIIQPFTPIKDLEENIIDRVMNINFFGPVLLTKAFLDNLLTREEGYIVNVSSMGGFFPFPNQTIYGASKAALKLFTEGLYSELKGTNVHTMVVFPGAINTNILKNSNVDLKGISTSSGNYKMTSPEDTASQIVTGIEKNKFKVYVGSDCKFMKFIYKLSSKKAIDFINDKMKS
ncbi:MAG: SDR family oxidoreductase [Bacilli bacterium]|nr:SDR family oxidoreductase [Bacilli bacterium]